MDGITILLAQELASAHYSMCNLQQWLRNNQETTQKQNQWQCIHRTQTLRSVVMLDPLPRWNLCWSLRLQESHRQVPSLDSVFTSPFCLSVSQTTYLPIHNLRSQCMTQQWTSELLHCWALERTCVIFLVFSESPQSTEHIHYPILESHHKQGRISTTSAKNRPCTPSRWVQKNAKEGSRTVPRACSYGNTSSIEMCFGYERM